MNSLDDVIDRYEDGGRILLAAIDGVSPEKGRERIGPGEWSISEVVAHLLDSDLVGADRIKRVIAEDHPILQAYDQDAWIARLDARSMPIDEAARLFALNREWMARILRNCEEADFGRIGHHTETGMKTLAALVTGYSGHLDSHLRFLYGKRGALGIGIIPRYSHSQD